MNGPRAFFSRPGSILGGILVCLIVAVAVAAPLLAPPTAPGDLEPTRRAGRGTDLTPHPPSAQTVLGTTSGQYDVYYTVIWGTRFALLFGLSVALGSAALGVVIGAVAGYTGGLLGHLLLRVTDAFLAFPVIAGLWLFQQILTAPDTATTVFQHFLVTFHPDPVLLALILFSWMPYARLINASMQRLKTSDYVEAARAVGVRNRAIIFRHLLPNAVSPAIVLAARDIGAAVVLQAGFTFIGVASGSPWGFLLVSGRDWIVGPGGNPLAYWWVYLPATLALMLFGIAWNLLGDGLNDMLNPRARAR